MRSPSHHKLSDFYKHIPLDQQAFVEEFRRTHAQKQNATNRTTRTYFDSNSQCDILLLLHGGFADFSMWIHQIVAFEMDYRVIAPTCPNLPHATMKAYSEGLVEILKAEKVEKTNLMGYSEDGLIAQCFLREQPSLINKIILAQTFYPSSDNKYYQLDFNLFRTLPASVTEMLFRVLAKPDREELHPTNLEWLVWYKAYFKELKNKLTKEIIITHIDLMIDFSRNYSFTPDDLRDWHGDMLITVSEDDTVSRYFEGLKKLYPFAQTYIFGKGLGAHSNALITPKIFNNRIRLFLEG